MTLVMVETSMLSEVELRIFAADMIRLTHEMVDRGLVRQSEFAHRLAVALAEEVDRREELLEAVEDDGGEGGLAAGWSVPDGWVVDGPPDCPPGVSS